MNKKKTTIYTDETMQLGAEVENFLPSPEELVFKGSPQEKITITIDSETLEFFRAKAKQLKAPYQRMIRNLLQEYVKMQG